MLDILVTHATLPDGRTGIDVLVQGGNLHTFINRWAESCMLLFVVVTGRRANAAGPTGT